MRLSFRESRHLGIGVLLGTILLFLAVSTVTLWQTMRTLSRYRNELRIRQDCLGAIILHLTTVRADFVETAGA